MLFDHTGDSIVGYFSFLNLIGRISFPIFAFQAVIGYINTKNLKKHMIKLLIFACISQIPFMLFLSTYSTNVFYFNIFFTFLLGLAALYIFDKCNNKILGFILVLIISIFCEFIKVDYGMFGILLMFLFYFFKDNKIKMSISYILLCIFKYSFDIFNTPTLLTHYLFCMLFTALPIIFILLYNKKQGPKLKYFFYIFYPLHLLILYILNIAL